MSGASENLRRHAHRSPQRTACIEGRTEYRYRELDGLVDGLTASLREQGVETGDRVGLLLGNGIAFVIAYLAVLRAGAAVVPMDVRAPGAAIDELIADASLRLLLCDRGRAGDLEGSSSVVGAKEAPLPGVPASLRMLLCRRQEVSPGEGVAGLASIIYTSGTTGRPKGVMLSVANVQAVAEAGAGFVQLGPEDRVGLVTPLSHLYGLREIDACVLAGAALVLVKELAYPARVVAELHDCGVTGLSTVPSGMTLVMERYGELLSRCREHLRYIALGTALAPSSLLAAIRSCLPGTDVLVTYGLTEASRVCYRLMENDAEDPLSVGRPYPGVVLRVLDEEGAEVDPGRPGRIAVESKMVMRGYWRRRDRTAEVIREDGSLLTPDYGWLDAAGALHLNGRVDEVINCGGEKVAPEEVELVLRQHPGIADAAVAGVPDPARVLGEVVKAYVVRNPGESVEVGDLLRHCARLLPPYKVPKMVEFCESIPKTSLGKTVRSRLGLGGH